MSPSTNDTSVTDPDISEGLKKRTKRNSLPDLSDDESNNYNKPADAAKESVTVSKTSSLSSRFNIFKIRAFQLFIALSVSLLIGLGFTLLVLYFPGTNQYLNNELMKNLNNKNNDHHWLYYFSLFLFGRTAACLNFYPMIYWKSKIMRNGASNLRANMQIYKIQSENEFVKEKLNEDEASVVLVEDGPIGSYNRANRSLTHFIETNGFLLISFYSLAKLLPALCCVIMGTYCFGRILHQTGYAVGGYGKHGLGFLLSVVPLTMLEGLNLVVGWKVYHMLNI